MYFALIASAIAAALFGGMLALVEVGRRIGARRLAGAAGGAPSGSGVMDGSVFGLLGLLVAFTFSGAASRFDARRALIVDEANAIGTAWLRIDMLPADAQPALRDGFRRYLDARLSAYAKLPDVDAARRELTRAQLVQEEIWARAAAVCRTEAGAPARMLLLPAMNEMFDLAQTRTMATQQHPPAIIFITLAVVALVGAVLAGYAMAGAGRRSWIHMLCFSGTIAISVYVILEIEYPRLGYIRVDDFDRALVDVRAAMR